MHTTPRLANRVRGPRILGVLGGLALIALSGACGGSSTKSQQSASTTAATQAQGTKKPAFIDIEKCDNDSGAGNASGTVQNQGTTATAYRLQLGFYDTKTDKLLATAKVDISSVDPGATSGWEATVSGLGGADVVCHTVALDTVSGSGTAAGAPSSTTTSAPAATDFPCSLVAQADVEQIAGNPLDRGDASTNHVTEDTLSWTARECAWLKPGADKPTELRLAVSRGADLPASTPCPPLAGTTTPVPGLGQQAKWSWTNPGTSVTVGNLRVCGNGVVIDVVVTGPTSGDAHLNAATALAQKALASL